MPRKKIEISVIIPTYKPKDYIFTCLESLSRQTLSSKKIEIIIVLNGCYEPFYTKINNFIEAHKDSNFILLHTETPGVSNARNIALKRAKGRFITFIDDDDYISDCYLQELLEISDNETIGLCRPIAFYDGENKELSYRITKVFDKYADGKKHNFQIARKFFSGPCMKLIAKDIIQDRQFNTTFKNGEDSLFMFEISDKFRFIKFSSPNAIYYRRYRTNSASTKKRSYKKRIFNASRLILAESKLYFTSFKTYSTKFYFTRILGAIKAIFLG